MLVDGLTDAVAVGVRGRLNGSHILTSEGKCSFNITLNAKGTGRVRLVPFCVVTR